MLYRFQSLDTTRAQDQDGDYVVEMAFASEVPYERWWGIEVLDCGESSVRLGRLNDGANVLFNHNWNELRGVHIANSVRCDSDKVVRGQVRLTSATQAGRDTINLVKSGVLTKTSVGYEIHKVIEQTTTKDGRTISRELDGTAFEGVRTRADEVARGDLGAFRRMLDERFGAFERASDDPVVYRVVDWEPIENSLVTVPADATVGVGRSAEVPVVHPPKGTPSGVILMTEAVSAPAGGTAETTLSPENVRALEKARCDALAQLAEANAIESGVVRRWIGAGLTANQAAEEVIDILQKRAEKNTMQGLLDMEKKEVKQYSIFRAVQAVLENNWQKAGLELKAHEDMAKKLGKETNSNNSFFVPLDVQMRSIEVRDEAMERRVAEIVAARTGRRDLTVGTGNAGGFLVDTSNQGFIELARNQTVLYALGARRLGGLRDSITIPRQTSGATPYWLATEATAITESQLVLGQISMTPKTVGAYTEISRQLTLQGNPDAENLVMVDLAAQVAVDKDAKGINGSGASGQPTGLLNTSGTGSVTGTSIAYAGIIEFQTDVFGGNTLMAGSAYLTTGTVAGLLKQRVKFSSTASPLWDGRLEMGNVDGYTGMASNQVPAGTLIFGDFSQVLIGEWGVLEVEVNPYANFQAGIIGIRAMSSMDVAIRYPSAFSIATSVT